MNRTTKDHIKPYFLSFVFILAFVVSAFLTKLAYAISSPFAQAVMIGVSRVIIVGMTVMLCYEED